MNKNFNKFIVAIFLIAVLFTVIGCDADSLKKLGKTCSKLNGNIANCTNDLSAEKERALYLVRAFAEKESMSEKDEEIKELCYALISAENLDLTQTTSNSDLMNSLSDQFVIKNYLEESEDYNKMVDEIEDKLDTSCTDSIQNTYKESFKTLTNLIKDKSKNKNIQKLIDSKAIALIGEIFSEADRIGTALKNTPGSYLSLKNIVSANLVKNIFNSLFELVFLELEDYIDGISGETMIHNILGLAQKITPEIEALGAIGVIEKVNYIELVEQIFD